MLEELNAKLVKRIEEETDEGQFDLGNAYNDFNSLVDYYKAEDTNQTFTEWCKLENSTDVLSDITYWLDTVNNVASADISNADYELITNYIEAVVDTLE